MKQAHFKEFIADANNLSDTSTAILRRKFAFSRLAKAIWNSNTKCFITKSLRAKLNLLIQTISDKNIHWETRIAHLIPRTPDYQAWGDSSLDAAGGYSFDLGFTGISHGMNPFAASLLGFLNIKQNLLVKFFPSTF